MTNQTRACAFGLLWQADTALDHFRSCSDETARADVCIRRAADLPPRSTLSQINRGSIFSDGFRFQWDDEVVFDTYNGDTVVYVPGPAWTGKLPLPFYSTVAAMLLAWRGGIVLHASAVAIEGRAIVICGAAGAGKSTVSAALVSAGARFLSDDLTLVDWRSESADFVVYPGRPTIRLHPATARWLEPSATPQGTPDDRGKSLVAPVAFTRDTAVPVAGFLWLTDHCLRVNPILRWRALDAQLFRPRWQSRLPQQEVRQRKLRALANAKPMACALQARIQQRSEFDRLATQSLEVVRREMAG